MSVRRVLLVTTSFAPEVGGVETHLVELVGELQRRGVEVAVLRQDELPLGRARDDHGALAEPRGVRVHRARRRAFWRAMRQLTDPRGPEVPDVVHVHDYSRPLLLQAVGSCRGRPLVFTPHGGLLSPPERARRGDRLVMAAFDRFVAARILGRVRCVVALTEEQRQAICDGYGVAPERVVVLPNMVPSDARVVGAASRGAPAAFWPSHAWRRRSASATSSQPSRHTPIFPAATSQGRTGTRRPRSVRRCGGPRRVGCGFSGPWSVARGST